MGFLSGLVSEVIEGGDWLSVLKVMSVGAFYESDFHRKFCLPPTHYEGIFTSQNTKVNDIKSHKISILWIIILYLWGCRAII